jgi:hypothetical protein
MICDESTGLHPSPIVGRCSLLFALALLAMAQAGAQEGEMTALVLQVTAPPVNHPSGTAGPRVTGTSAFLPRVGGGARANWAGNGSLLTQTAPSADSVASWSAAAKEHLAADPAALDLYAIYLAAPPADWEVVVHQATGAVAPHPVASVSLPPGYVMTGGGCTSNWKSTPAAAGNLLTASFPSSNTTWECRGKDHGVPSPASLTAYVIGIRPVRAGVPLPLMQITRARSEPASHPTAFAPALAGHVVTGGGALALPARPQDAGQLLTGSFPELRPAQLPSGSSLSFGFLGQAGFTQAVTPSGWRATSKDHAYASPGTVEAFAINLRFGDAATGLGVAHTPPSAPTQQRASAGAASGARNRTPPPGMSATQQSPGAQGATILGPDPASSGPPPQLLTTRTQATYIQVTWQAVAGAREYDVWRSINGRSGEKISPNGFTAVELWDAVENPRDSYRYTVVARYPDGRYGSASVEARPTYTTPNTPLRAERVGETGVRFSWPEIFGAVAYRLDGGRLPNTGTMVEGGRFAPPARWTPASSGAMSVVIPDAATTAAATYSLTALYPHNLADYSTQTRAEIAATAGRYRITLNGFRCNVAAPDGPFNSDGLGNEVFPLIWVHDIDRRTGLERASYYVRTPIYGDSHRFPARVSAGSLSSTGGITDGDVFPRGGIPGVRASEPPPVRSESQYLPALIWSGELRDGVDTLLLKPTLWEHDGDETLLETWMVEQQRAPLANLLAALNAAPRADLQPTIVPGNALPKFPGWRPELGMLNFLQSATGDRPIGLEAIPNSTYRVRQPVIQLTREAVEVELRRAPGQTTNGILSVTVTDANAGGGPGAPPAPASYTVFLQVERLP